MKKKFFIGLFIFATIGLFIFAHLALRHNAMQDEQPIQGNLSAPIEIPEGNIIKYEEAEKLEKPMVVMFYVDWCTYCRRFMPIFAKYSEKFGKNYTFTVINCDIPKNFKMVTKFNVMGYPSIFVIDKKLDFDFQLNHIITIDEDVMKNELNKYSKLRMKALKN